MLLASSPYRNFQKIHKYFLINIVLRKPTDRKIKIFTKFHKNYIIAISAFFQFLTKYNFVVTLTIFSFVNNIVAKKSYIKFHKNYNN